MKNFFLLLALIYFASINLIVSLPLNTQYGELPTNRRTIRRASLHELLRKNKNIASVGQDDNTPTSIRHKDDSTSNRSEDDSLNDSASKNVPDNNDLLLEVKANSKETLTFSDNLESLNADDVINDKTRYREAVTKYVNPFTSRLAPSYADPNLLSAVMDQADSANYKYPSDVQFSTNRNAKYRQELKTKQHSQVPKEPENEINPYNLFPPAFHGFLDMPVHINPNESENDPEEKSKVEFPNAPKISGGYSSAKVNGQKSIPTEHDHSIDAPSRTSLRYSGIVAQPLITTAKSVDLLSTTKSNELLVANDHHHYPYIEIGKNLSERIRENRIPKPTSTRTSLRFRTMSPESLQTTEESNILDLIKDSQVVATNFENYSKDNIESQESKLPIKKDVFRKETIYSDNSYDSAYGHRIPSNRQRTKPVIKEKENFKHFKPSKVDPYINKLPSSPPFIKQKDNFVVPTTFRPKLVQNNNFVVPTTFRPKHYQPISPYFSVLPPVTNTFDRYDIAENNKEDTKSNSVPQLKRNIVTNSNSNDNNFESNFPFARHPSLDKSNHQHELRPVYLGPSMPFFPPHVQGKIKAFASNFESSLRPPPIRKSDTFIDRNQFRADSTRRYKRPQNHGSSLNRKRPTFLQNMRFFSKSLPFEKRSGKTSLNLEKNRLKFNLNKKKLANKGYRLTKGPVPPNSRKVTVIGPFKNPPIGAPVVRPHQPPLLGDSIFPTEPPFKLIPPSPFKIPNNFIEKSSFKVINLPKENGIEVNVKNTESENIEYLQNIIPNNPFPLRPVQNNLKNETLIIGNSTISNRKFVNSDSAFVNVATKFNTASTKNKKHFSKFSNIKDEVSDEDKEKLIAAKIHFPRIQTIRRSGLERHMIPIPVPLLTSSGRQVPQLQKIILPHAPFKRRMAVDQHYKIPRRVGSSYPLLPIRYSTNLRQTKYTQTLPLGKSNSRSKIREIKSISPSHNSKTRNQHYKNIGYSNPQNILNQQISDNEDTINQNKQLQTVKEKNIKTLHMRSNPTSKPITQEKFYERPQSYQEPSRSPVNYGGWKVIGVTKVDPNGDLEPVVSYVKENIPEIKLKSDLNNKKDELYTENDFLNNLEIKNGHKNPKQVITNKNSVPIIEYEINQPANTIINNESNSVQKSFLVQPSNSQ